MTKEEKAIYMIAYREKNKDKIKQQNREHHIKNRESIIQKKKEWRQTDAGIKSQRISNWKRLGMILIDDQTWDSIYRKYIECENCQQCNKVFQTTLDRQLDHCHTTGYIRNIVCQRCNQLRRYEDAKKLI